ncbi:purine-cytosine permease family protein [Novosphingobium resinovorum]|uniref:purine-cytosine permease family protein n=1 Tax=Novosphingobium resinovorum TaxID=158500 RepID=UPI002ED1B50D|nr:cytosine permease [Novosphingobium resinovorum]
MAEAVSHHEAHHEAGDQYANAPLPEALTVGGWRVALIIASFSISLPTFLNGAQTSLALGFWPAVLAAFLAGTCLCLGGCLTSLVAVRSRLNTYLLIRRSFGLRGAGLVNIIIAIVHFCWFGVNVSFLGDAIAAAGEGFGFAPDFTIIVVAGAALMALTTLVGFRALDRLAMIGVPLLAAMILAVCIAAARRHGIVLAPPATSPYHMTFGIAVSAIIGGDMLTITTLPDLSRYTRSGKGAVLSMALSYPFTAPLLMAGAALAALATGETDIMRMITGFGFGAWALLLLVMPTWTLNSLNLYSASLSLSATFPRVPRWAFILGGTVVGTALALMGIIEGFIPFLVLLGVTIPPFGAIYVIDGWTRFRNVDPARSIEDLSGIHWPAVATWAVTSGLAGIALHYDFSVTTIPALDAVILASVLYLGLMRIAGRR